MKASRPSVRGLNLSPSVNHHRVMDRTIPALRFRGGDVRAWQRRLRAKLCEITGYELMPTRRPRLQVRTLWRRDHELGAIEKITFASEPGADVTGYFCRPVRATSPYGCFICLQGHSTGMHNSIAVDFETESRPIKVPGDRDFAIGCLKRGIAALCLEQRSLGERGEQVQKFRAPAGCHDATMHALALGRTLIAERVYDVDRGIDYLASRGDIRLDQVGVMGNSGGGTTSLFAGALLARVQFAMISGYFCTFRDSLMSLYHCMDNYVPGILRWAEMGDVLGLFAPRPVLVVNGPTDGIFPFPAARREFRHLKKIYAAAGAADRCRFVAGHAGHRFYARRAWEQMLPMLRREPVPR